MSIQKITFKPLHGMPSEEYLEIKRLMESDNPTIPERIDFLSKFASNFNPDFKSISRCEAGIGIESTKVQHMLEKEVRFSKNQGYRGYSQYDIYLHKIYPKWKREELHDLALAFLKTYGRDDMYAKIGRDEIIYTLEHLPL